VRRRLALALVVLASASLATAQSTSTTRLVPYAGTAVDAGGAPFTGAVTAIFELYEEPEGGSPLWHEIQNLTTDARGRYLAYLGSETPIP
jgi:hypothetical protein